MTDECEFCAIAAGELDADLVALRTEQVFIAPAAEDRGAHARAGPDGLTRAGSQRYRQLPQQRRPRPMDNRVTSADGLAYDYQRLPECLIRVHDHYVRSPFQVRHAGTNSASVGCG
jgi:hypothetical protein